MSYKRKRPAYEGKSYTGGRVKGRQNLKRTDGGDILNQHGVVFTEAEKRALESAVTSANRQRQKMLKAEAQLPRTVMGKATGDTVNTLHLMGKESDFILSRKSKSLQRFRTRHEFEQYMGQLGQIRSNVDEYINTRVGQYKENHIQAIRNVYGADADDVVDKIKGMSPREYMKRVQAEDEFLDIQYVYSNEEKTGKLNRIRRSLKLDEADEEYEELE